ncbi:NADH-quinone oxidoreductase subunit NuoN [Thiofilum flexile]|uniref:NADH-quinone oxidoreductase subunit NuoN n=1 Tax=Thiofilum flexile TaxID=125627 RepID=UPI00035F0596|nr:NADH-quinone oxidoreductase subunit NuoN [Thiofilum flexile]
MNGIGFALPEIFMLVAALVVLLVDLFLRQHSRILTYMLTQAALLAAALLVYGNFADGPARQVVGDMYMHDYLSSLLKVMALLLTCVIVVYGRKYWSDHQEAPGEFYVLVLFTVLGMMLMVSSTHLIVLYLGLELMSLSLYALVSLLRDDSRATEAAMKYFILGALASGMLLYGISILYGLTGSLELLAIAEILSHEGSAETVPLLLALVFLIAGLGFKLGVVPFHMWVPDVYQGAPTAVTALIASIPKLATLALLVRLLVSGLGNITSDWAQILMVLGMLSIMLGNLVAIAQMNLKRMLAYSAIAHMGFILLGISTQTMDGNSAALFYALVYVVMSVGGFGVLILLGQAGIDAETLYDLKGLNKRSPWFAFMMLLLLFSMAGIPPLAGFHAKLLVINAVLQAGHLVLAVGMVIMSVIGAFYYLRAIKMMYFDEPDDSTPLKWDLEFGLTLSLNGVWVLVIGLMPSFLMTVCVRALDAKHLL